METSSEKFLTSTAAVMSIYSCHGIFFEMASRNFQNTCWRSIDLIVGNIKEDPLKFQSNSKVVLSLSLWEEVNDIARWKDNVNKFIE